MFPTLGNSGHRPLAVSRSPHINNSIHLYTLDRCIERRIPCHVLRPVASLPNSQELATLLTQSTSDFLMYIFIILMSDGSGILWDLLQKQSQQLSLSPSCLANKSAQLNSLGLRQCLRRFPAGFKRHHQQSSWSKARAGSGVDATSKISKRQWNLLKYDFK